AAARNLPGKYRATLERSYALQRSVQPDACAAAAKQVLRDLGNQSSYPWLEVQAGIQAASCLDIGGSNAEALDLLERAEKLAELHQYKEAGLRAAGIYTESLTTLGDRDAAWVRGIQEMQTYWDSESSPARAYQILINQFWAAQKMDWPRAAAILGTAACREVPLADRLAELSCRTELAGVARKVGDQDLASAQSQAAASLADALQNQIADPRSPALGAMIRYASA